MTEHNDSSLAEAVLAEETVYEGRIVKLYLQTVRLPNGQEVTREIVRHSGAVAIVPLHEDGRVTLVRQFRLPAQQVLLEVPAGTLEPDEVGHLLPTRGQRGHRSPRWPALV